MDKPIVKFPSNFLSEIPKDMLQKHGWVLLATPVIIYAIDKAYVLVNKAIDNNYSLNFNSDKFQLSLEK